MITFWVVSLVHFCSYCKGTIVLFVKQGNEGYQRGVVRKKILFFVVSGWYIMKCGFLKFALRQCDLWKPPQAPPKEGMSLSKAFKLRGRQLLWIPMFRKELCVPSAFCAIRVFCVKKWVSVIQCRNFKHREHRRLLPGDYTEYLKEQRIHRKASPRKAWEAFSLSFVTPLHVTRYIFISHTLIKGIKIVEFKGKKA